MPDTLHQVPNDGQRRHDQRRPLPLGGTLAVPDFESDQPPADATADQSELKVVRSLHAATLRFTLQPEQLPPEEQQQLHTLTRTLPRDGAEPPSEPGFEQATRVGGPPPPVSPAGTGKGTWDGSPQAQPPADGTATWAEGSAVSSPEGSPPQPAPVTWSYGQSTRPPGSAVARTWDHLVIRPRAVARRTAQETVGDADYQLVSELGRGAMGIVFAARQRSIDRSVAIKMLTPELARNEKQRGQFLAEAVVTGELDHPNIVPIYDLAQNQEGALFYSMKHVHGRPWSQEMAKKSLAENLDTWMRVADAVALAHDRGVVHRDLKPENVMLGDYGEVLLMDWGIAVSRTMLQDPVLRESNGLAGTPAYMAPEMAVDGPLHRIGPAADIYLLGAILFEIVTRFPPHTGRTVMECLQHAARNLIVPAPEENELLDIARQAMNSEPAQRYAQVKDLQAAVREHLSHAESNLLVARGENRLQAALQRGDYNDYQQAILAFREALGLWEGNDHARQQLDAAVVACAKQALANGDYDLGLSVLDRDNPKHQPLVRRLRAGRRRRKSVRLAIISLIAAVVLVSVVAAIWVEGSRRIAVAAKIDAEFQRGKAVENEQKAVANEKEAVAEKIAADKARAAEATQRAQAQQSAREAREAAEEAERQRGIAESERDRAQKARDEEARARTAAEEAQRKEAQQRQRAEDNERQAVAATYRARIALAASHIDANGFNLAKTQLDEIAAQAKDSPWFTPRPWEFARLQYMLGLSEQTIPLGYAVQCLAISPDGQRLAAGGDDSRVRVWRRGQIEPERTITAELPQVAALSFSRSGRWLLTASNSAQEAEAGRIAFTNQITAWDLQTGKDLPIVGRTAGVGAAATPSRTDDDHWVVSLDVFGPDDDLQVVAGVVNRRFQTALDDRPAALVRIYRGGALTELVGHQEAIGDTALAPDGNTLVSVDNLGHVQIWRKDAAGEFRLLRERDRQSFVPHDNKPVYAASFSPDGLRVATAGGDNRVLVWDTADLIDPKKPAASLNPVYPPAAHAAAVHCLDFSRDGQRLVSGSEDGTVRVWQVAEGRQEALFRGHSNAVRAVAFIPGRDDDVVSASLDQEVRLWNAARYREFLTLSSTEMPEILQAAFARHGQTVVTAHRKDIQYGAVALWELQDEGGKLRPVTAPQAILQEGHTFPISSAVVSRRGDATEILTIGVDANVCFWDAQQRRQVLRLSGVSRQLSFGSPLVATSADGRFVLAAGSGGFLAKIWDRQKLNPAAGHPPLQVLEGHFGFVTSVAISRSGKYLLTGDQAGRAIFWKQDPATGQYASGWSVPPAGFKISSVAFLPDESRAILAASYQIRQFDVASGKELEARRLNASDDIASLAMSRDGARLLTGCTNGTLTLWDLNQPDAKAARLATLAARNRQIKAVALAAGGKVALDVGSPANDVRLLSLGAGDTLQEVATLNLPGQAADSAAFVTDDGAQIVVAGGVQARLWNVSRTPPQLLHEFRPDAVATSAQVSADGASVLSCHEDGVVKIWDSASGLVRARLTGQPTVGVRFAAFHPDGKELVTAALDGSVAIWNAAGGEFLRLLCRHASGKPLRHAAFSRDGSLLVTASDDRTAQIWDAVSGAPQHILEGHSGAVLCAAFSPDGRWLVTGGEDPEARMWSVETGQTVALLQGHGKQVATVGFSPDGRRVATGSADETAKIWAIRFQTDARQQTIGIESVDEVLTLRSHRGEVTSAEFSPDGRNLLTGSRDGRAIVWPSAPGP